VRLVGHRHGGRGDAGQISLLVIGYCTIALGLLSVVASASAVHLERKRLMEVADSAALDAADALDSPLYYGGGAGVGPPGTGVPLTDASVHASVGAYLRLRGAAAEFEDLSVSEPTGTPDGSTAEVTLVARVRLPLVSAALESYGDGIVLRASARARTDLG
jgi:hypothetical protein